MAKSYIPKKGSASYAMLVALYFMKDSNPEGVDQDALILKANSWATQPIEYNKEGQIKHFNPMGPLHHNYTGWSSMSGTLIKSHELVQKKFRSKKPCLYLLTEKGQELASKIIERDQLVEHGPALFGVNNAAAAATTTTTSSSSNKKSRDKSDDKESNKKAKFEVFNLENEDDNDDDIDIEDNSIDFDVDGNNYDDEYLKQQEIAYNSYKSSNAEMIEIDIDDNDIKEDYKSDNNTTFLLNYDKNNDNNNDNNNDRNNIYNDYINDNDNDDYIDPEIIKESIALAKQHEIMMNAYKASDNDVDYTYNYSNDYEDQNMESIQQTLDAEHVRMQMQKIQNQQSDNKENFIFIDDSEDESIEHENEKEENYNDKQSAFDSMLDSLTKIDEEAAAYYKENININDNIITTAVNKPMMKPIVPPEVIFPKSELYDEYQRNKMSTLPIGPWWKDGAHSWDQCREPCSWYLDDFATMASSSLFIDYFDIILLVTTGEADCIAYLNNELKKFQEEMRKKKSSYQIKVETRHLNIGDFMWIARYKKNPQYELVLNAICERKTFVDLHGSITNNHGQVSSRYMSQKRRLMYSGISTRLYLLEGTIATALNSARNSGKHKQLNADTLTKMDATNKKILTTAVAETQLAGFSLVRTENPKATANFLLQFTRRMFFSSKVGCRNLHEMMNDTNTPKISFNDFDAAFNAREVLGRSTYKSITGRVLMGLRNVGKKTILKLMEKYPSMRALYDSLNSEIEKQEFLTYMCNSKDDKAKVNNIISTFTKLY